MEFLALSTGALFLGPLLGWLLRASVMGLHMLDGFVLVSILGVCLVHMLPEALAAAGPAAAITLAAGFIVPGLVEHTLTHSARRTHVVVLVLASLGLLMHAFLDGAALSGVHHHGEELVTHGSARVAMAWGVLLHRIPVGLMIWWAFRPIYGTAAGVGLLVAIGATTVAGFFAAHGVVEQLEYFVAGHVMAAVAGSILHVVLHQTGPEAFSGKRHPCPSWAGAGALAALGLLVWSAGQGGPAQESTVNAFLDLVLESAPALLAGFLFAGVVQEFLPEAGLEWLRRGGPLGQATKGMAFGLPLPICSCGVVPVYRSLMDRGAPVAAAVAFLVATPEVGLDAVLLSLPLLGARLTAVRVGAAIVVALVAGVVLGVLYKRPEEDPAAPGEAAGGSCCPSSSSGSSSGCGAAPDPVDGGEVRPFATRLREALRYGAVDLVDHTGPWILLGLAVAAILEPALDLQGLATMAAWQQVLLMTVIGMPMYVCAAGATPVAAVLMAKGVAPGAVLAFLLAGPVTNATTFGVLRDLHGRNMASLFVLVLVTTCVAVGLGVEALPAAWVEPSGRAAGHAHEHAWWQVGAAVMVGMLFLSALFRQGPRGLADQVVEGLVPHSHDHGVAEEDHEDPGCGHHHVPEPEVDDCCA